MLIDILAQVVLAVWVLGIIAFSSALAFADDEELNQLLADLLPQGTLVLAVVVVFWPALPLSNLLNSCLRP